MNRQVKGRINKFVLLLVIVSIICVPATMIQASTEGAEITVIINEDVQVYDQPPVIVNGRLMVPMRSIFEKMEAQVHWDGQLQRVIASKGEITIVLDIGSIEASINNSTILLDAEARIIGGRTLVPLRFVGEAFGAEVLYDSPTRTVRIRTPEENASQVTEGADEEAEERIVVRGKDVVPTLFVHGFSGSTATFSKMVEYLDSHAVASFTDVIIATSTGEVSFERDMSSHTNQPLIVVGFENNVARLADQTAWFTSVVQLIQDKYDNEKINIVGHSMGGLVAIDYILSTEGHDVEKLVTLGSPIKGTSIVQFFTSDDVNAEYPGLVDLEPGSDTLKQLFAQRSSFNPSISVLSIAGTRSLSMNGDGVVPVSSALGLKDYTSNIVLEEYGLNHTQLHSTEEIYLRIIQFLWGE